jgi:hypothetical protein
MTYGDGVFITLVACWLTFVGIFIAMRPIRVPAKINFHFEDADCEISTLIEAANMDDTVKAFFIVENSHKQERVEMNPSVSPSIH